MQPAINNGFSRCRRVLPISRHNILALDNDFALLAQWHLIAIVVENLQLQRLDNLTRRAEAMTPLAERVSRDNRCSLRQAVALQHRHTHSVEESLQLRVEQRSTAYEEFYVATKSLAHLLKENLIEQCHKRFQHKTPALALCVAILVILVGNLQCKLKELFDLWSLLVNRSLDILAEILCQRRNGQQYMRLNLADIYRYILQCFEWGATNLRCRHRSTTSHHNIEACNMGKAVVEWQDDKHRIVRRDRDTSQCLLDICGVVAVCQDNTLRVCRSTRSVGDCGVVIILNCATNSQKLLTMLCKVFFAHCVQLRKAHLALLQLDIAPYDDVLQEWQLLTDITNLRELIARYENCTNLCVAQTEK